MIDISKLVQIGKEVAPTYYKSGQFASRARKAGVLNEKEILNAEKYFSDGFSDIKYVEDAWLPANGVAKTNPKTGEQYMILNPSSDINPELIIHEENHLLTYGYDPLVPETHGNLRFAPENVKVPIKKIIDNAAKEGLKLKVRPEFASYENTYKYYLKLGRTPEQAKSMAEMLHKTLINGKRGRIDGYFRTGQETRSHWLSGRQWLIDNTDLLRKRGIETIDQLTEAVKKFPDEFKGLLNADQRWKIFTPESMGENYKNMFTILAPTLLTVGAVSAVAASKTGGILNYLEYSD